MARLLIFVQALESMPDPLRHARTRFRGKSGYLLEIMDGNEPRHDGNRDATRTRAIDETKVDIVVEEKLGDGGGGAYIDLRLQHVDIGLNAGRLRMLFRI